MEVLQLIISGVSLGCVYGLIALGFVLIYKATEMVNFAQGDMMMLGAFIGYTYVNLLGLPFFVGVLAVALDSLGRTDEAIALLESATERFPGDLDIGIAQVSYLHKAGRQAQAVRAANQLQLRFPGHPAVQALLRDLFTDQGAE